MNDREPATLHNISLCTRTRVYKCEKPLQKHDRYKKKRNDRYYPVFGRVACFQRPKSECCAVLRVSSPAAVCVACFRVAATPRNTVLRAAEKAQKLRWGQNVTAYSVVGVTQFFYQVSSFSTT